MSFLKFRLIKFDSSQIIKNSVLSTLLTNLTNGQSSGLASSGVSNLKVTLISIFMQTLRFVGLGGQSGISSATAKNPLGSDPVSKALEAQKKGRDKCAALR